MFSRFNTYNIFISHSWNYSEHYERILEWLDQSNISYRDYSIPIDKSLPQMRKDDLKKRIMEQIRHASVVIVFAAMYDEYSEWIQFEIKTAQSFGKPFLVIRPWGQERVPRSLSGHGLKVNWNSRSVIDGFKSLV